MAKGAIQMAAKHNAARIGIAGASSFNRGVYLASGQVRSRNVHRQASALER